VKKKTRYIVIFSLFALIILVLPAPFLLGDFGTPDPENGSDYNGYANNGDVSAGDDLPALNEEPDYIYENDDFGTEFRAVWVTTVFNLDFPSRQDLTADEMKREIDSIVAHTAYMGLNAIIFQVRPMGDAFYASDIFPWSQWLVGTQGEGIPDFDPLQYFIEASHAKGIELHAWLNPYRIIHTALNTSDPNTLAADNPVRLNPHLAVPWSTTEGRQGLFLDPGLPEARQLILDGIEEIVLNYDIDGIHFDDYFYPGPYFDDAESFARYGGDMELGDWRRENVNTLIRDIQSLIHGINQQQGRNVRWGISPTAIWKNETTDPLGKPTTRGMESYYYLYADTRLWVTEGWVDYIMPQIYWYIGFEIANFEPVLNWWIDLCRGTDVNLYIGLAAWREVDRHQGSAWDGEILRQLHMMAQSDVVGGSAFFRYAHMTGAFGSTIREYFAARDAGLREPLFLLEHLSVGKPERNVTITGTDATAAGFNVLGTSIPSLPLYLNGQLVTNRTVEGFFFVHVPLEAGANVFTFSQEGQDDVVRTITRNPPTPGGDPPAPVTTTEVTSPRYARVIRDDAWVFPSHSTSGGSDWMLARDQVDRVIGESSNGFVRLSSGVWVRDNAVSIRTESDFIADVLTAGVYEAGTDYDIITWQAEENVAIVPSFDGSVLTVRFGMHTAPPPLSLPDDLSETMFQSVRSGTRNHVPYFEFTIRDDVRFEGQFVSYEDGELRLYLKHRKSLSDGDNPLEGIRILLDPGHGGDQPGAVGPLGGSMPESYLVLIHSELLTERLRALGATVYLTRETDVDISLQDRVNMSRDLRPDLFISLHINSVAETTNSENIRGFTVWYRNPNTVPFAELTLDLMYDIIPHTNRHRQINQANFFVCRPSWVPSVLFEAGFIVNLEDFVWLLDPVEQERMADATVEVILAYFGE